MSKNKNFKKQFWKINKWFGFLFIALFIFRIMYGYVAKDVNTNNDYSANFFGSIDNLRKNYASEKMTMKGDVQAASVVATNQKYEKTASIKSKSSEFDKDEKNIKEKSKSLNAVIQYEQNLGQKGNRQIHLLIGVNPNAFDSLYVALKKVGALRATEITKVDKTNEYRQLNAQKASIEKTLQSLYDLKSKNGQISDYIALNEKILDIEEKAQELGVELGNFNTENEFCTIKLSMYEGATEKNVSLTHRIKVALEWTIKYFAIIVTSCLILSLTVFIILFIVDKLKLMHIIKSKIED